jgi:hypothetical protein
MGGAWFVCIGVNQDGLHGPDAAAFNSRGRPLLFGIHNNTALQICTANMLITVLPAPTHPTASPPHTQASTQIIKSTGPKGLSGHEKLTERQLLVGPPLAP